MPYLDRPDDQRLELLLKAGHPCLLMVCAEESHAVALTVNAAVAAGKDVLTWSAVDGLTHAYLADGQPIADTENPAGALFFTSRLRDGKVVIFRDLSGHLQDPRTLRALREAIVSAERLGGTIVLIDHSDDLPAPVKSAATRVDVRLPDEKELQALVKATLREQHRRAPIRARLTSSEMAMVVKNLTGLTRRQVRQAIIDAVAEDREFNATDINHILALKRRALCQDGLLEYVETPVTLDEIGGLKHLKRWLQMRRRATDEDAQEFGITPPRGVLMLGVQGAGKSLCAKAIAAAWQRPLLRLDPSSLYDRYIGESERRLRSALAQAEAMSPIVLWIDEIEKGFASAGAASNDGGLSRRMFGTLLTWMQEHTAPVFLVATANDIEALPPELLRKGRFDEIFFVDLPEPATRRQIVEIHLRRRRRDPAKFDVDRIVAACEGYSGAEIEQGIVSALHEAFSRKQDLTTNMVVHALESSPPLSVTMAEKVEALRDWARDRCVPAD